MLIPRSRVLLAFVLLIALLGLDSCRSLKRQPNPTPTRTDSLQRVEAEDTTRSELGKQFDSLTNKVSGFLESLLPPALVKGETVLTPPPAEDRSPMPDPEGPQSDGFLNTPIRRQVEFDSAGNVVERDVFLGGDVSQPMLRSFDRYLEDQKARSLEAGFRDNVTNYVSDTSAQAGAGGWFDDYTQIKIPIPPSIVPSIFGKPSINLRVSGDVAVHLAYRDNQFLATSGALFSGSETGLDFRQEINISTNGTIGDKLKIGADWGSDRSFQFENLLKLGYQGYPDEILQSIEAGNVNLTTPSQYIGTQQALFGLKAVTRFGPAYVTTLAAQKKGDRNTRTFGGGAGSPNAQEIIIQPASYRRNAFFLDSTFIPNFERVYANLTADKSSVGTGPSLPESKLEVEVWRSTDNLASVKKRPAYTWYYLPPLGGSPKYSPVYHSIGTNDALQAFGNFEKLDTNQYQVDYNTGVLTLSQEPNDQQIIAVRYRLNNGEIYGESQSVNDTLVLKMIKPRGVYASPSFPAWKNILKNSYFIGATNVDTKDLQIRIVYVKPDGKEIEIVRNAEQKVIKVISALGLDRFNNQNPADATPDGLIDLTGQNNAPSLIFDRRTGTITFPYLEPFGDRVIQYFTEQNRKDSRIKTDSTFYFPQIYDTIPAAAKNFPKNSQISIRSKFSGGTSSTLNLGAFNIVDGSVKVSIGGNVLKENIDYRVDYNSGTVTLLNPGLASTGQISIDYETHDIFTTSTKTVLGLRTELPMADNGLLGFSLMNFSMTLPSLKTRQGEEPLSNWIAGVDASYNLDVPFVTDALNYLPFFNLRDKSSLAFRTDFALSMPNPNTQESPIPADNGASIAYLDDFEGGKNEFPLYSSYGRWVHASQPIGNSSIRGGMENTPLTDRLKAKTNWYEMYPQPVLIQHIKPNRSTQRASEQAQVLDVVFDPRQPGAYNHDPEQDYGSFPTESRWGGLMQYAPGLNIPATNTDAVEFWMKVEADGKNQDGVIRFNLGKITEDVIADNQLNTEDRNGNGRYDPGEDVGLDVLSNAEELEKYRGSPNGDDPSLDNYNYTSESQDYSRINGTEGNQNDRANSLKPDTEDLDANGAVDRVNSYFEYEIPINPTNNKYVVGQSEADRGWYQYRVPLADFKRVVGSQDYSNIAYYRFWFAGFQDRVHIKLHEVSLVGSQWVRGTRGIVDSAALADTSLKISYVNIEEHSGPPTNYKEPPGAQRDRLAGQTNYILGNEQSLNMEVSCLPNITDETHNQGREAIRVFQSPNDLFNYRAMAIYVHGGNDRPESISDTNGQVWVYVRFGMDRFNYYEYRQPLRRDWQNIHIDFARLTAMKAARGAMNPSITELADPGIPGSRYTVVGSPTLTNAPTFTLGIENRSAEPCLTTQVWWDELRLLDANDRMDYAVNASTQLKLAEFGKVTASIVNERADFHRVDERFNSLRTLNFNWNLTGEFAMQKILPKSMENTSQIPLTVSHTETIYRPKYLPNTDVEIESAIQKIDERAQRRELSEAEASRAKEEVRLSNETVTIKNSIGAQGVRLQFPGTFFLIPSFLNRLWYGFGYGEEFSRSPQFEYNRAWQWTGSLKYELPPLPKLSIDPLTWLGTGTFLVGPYANWKLNLLPQTLSFGLSTTRGRTNQLNRLSTLQYPPDATHEDSVDIESSRVPFITRLFTATRGMNFQWKPTEGGFLSPSFTYGLDVTSNLGVFEREAVQRDGALFSDSTYFYQRPISAIIDDIFFKDGKLVDPGRDFFATQRLSMQTSPRLPSLFGLEKLVRPIFSYSVDYRWQDAQTNLQNSKVGSWTNSITTGLELNVRDLGIMIFGKPIDDGPTGGDVRGVRGRPGQVGVTPERPDDPTYALRDQPPPTPRDEPINQVERGQEFRPQRRRHPTDAGPQLLDTLMRTGVTGATSIDTSGRKRLPGVGTGGERNNEWASDTVLTPKAPQVPQIAEEEEDPYTLKEIAQDFIQRPLFDWNGTRFNFTQTNSSQNPALQGSGPGISNFFVKGLFVPENDALGPSRAYQLGLITDPHGRLLIGFQPRFPFVKFDVRRGDRAPSPSNREMDIVDVFNQQNNFDLSTSRPLWEGATLSLNWKLQFSYDQRNTLHLNALGQDSLTYYAKSGDVSRTFLSMPEVWFVESPIGRVADKYREKLGQNSVSITTDDNGRIARDTMPPSLRNRLQRESFMEGFESLPFFSGLLREYLPRLNYSFNWTGLEKFFLFSFADRASFRHGYNGTYRRNWRDNINDPGQLTTLQTVQHGFRPLIALDMSWDKLWDGRLSSNIDYNTQTEWGSDYAAQRITKRLSTTLAVTANYQRTGISLPFLGLDLKNDFGATLSISKTVADDSYFTFEGLLASNDGIGNGGLTKTTIEPRLSYVISKQLTIEGFYRYERTEPAATGQLSPPTRLIMAGVDVRLKIQ